jgi:leader peptidase (prepilin peptidase)/N-methyltransferase
VTSLHIFESAGFVVGLIFGSFLNVCIARLPQHESIVKPRSRCPQCGAAIRWYDNIPVLSWVLLHGRCRDCGKSISIQYPLVELAVGLWFVKVVGLTSWIFYRDPNGDIKFSFDQIASGTVQGIGIAILGFLLIGLMVMDCQTMRLPDAFTLTGIFIGMLLVCAQAIFLGPGEDQIVLNSTHQLRLSSPGSFMSRGNVFLTGPEALIFGRLAAVCGAALILLVVRWIYKAVRHQDGMGLGDVKLLGMIAAFLGFWPAVLALFVGVMSASVWGVVLLARGRANRMSRLAFGSFLSFGGLIAALFGERVISSYAALLR